MRTITALLLALALVAPAWCVDGGELLRGSLITDSTDAAAQTPDDGPVLLVVRNGTSDTAATAELAEIEPGLYRYTAFVGSNVTATTRTQTLGTFTPGTGNGDTNVDAADLLDKIEINGVQFVSTDVLRLAGTLASGDAVPATATLTVGSATYGALIALIETTFTGSGATATDGEATSVITLLDDVAGLNPTLMGFIRTASGEGPVDTSSVVTVAGSAASVVSYDPGDDVQLIATWTIDDASRMRILRDFTVGYSGKE